MVEKCRTNIFLISIDVLNPFSNIFSIHLGNIHIGTKRAHGNSKSSTAPLFTYTPAATVAQIDNLVKTTPGATVYKHLTSINYEGNPPRNAAQCEYRRQKILQGQRITTDEINNLVLLSISLKSYFKLLQIQPEVLTVLIHDDMVQQFSRLTKVAKETVPVYYDTTFSLGEIFVSVRMTYIFVEILLYISCLFQIIGYKHIVFVQQPIVPLAVLFHDTKLQTGHERFIQIIHQHIPELGQNCILITDCEQALKNAFRLYYPDLQQLRCWNHFSENIKQAIKSHYLPNYEAPDDGEQDTTLLPKTQRELKYEVVDSIFNMLRASSNEEFLQHYEKNSQTWPSHFSNWFLTNIIPKIDELGKL